MENVLKVGRARGKGLRVVCCRVLGAEQIVSKSARYRLEFGLRQSSLLVDYWCVCWYTSISSCCAIPYPVLVSYSAALS